MPSVTRAAPRSGEKVGDAAWTKNVPNAGYWASTRPLRYEAWATARWKVARSVPLGRLTA